MADGTGVALRKKHTSKTKGKKGRKGKSKTRKVKMAVFFQGGIDSENNPFRMAESTTYSSRLDEFFNHLVAGLPQVACAA